MAKRKGSMQDFLDNFNAAYGTVSKVRQNMELADIANEKPEQSQAFDGQALGQAAAANPDGVKYDEVTNSYTVTPKADVSAKGDSVPVDPKTFSTQTVTDFLGKRSTGSMNESQVNAAKQRAMANVIMKSDPVQGVKLMRDVTQAERDDTRFGQEQTRFGNEQTMFDLNKTAAERAAKAAEDDVAKKAAGKHINDVLTQQGGDIRKAAAQIMTETNSSGLEGVKVDYVVGRDGLGRFVKTLPDGTVDAGQPIPAGTAGDLQIWQNVTSAISDPATVGGWYKDKLTRETDQSNKDADRKIKQQEADSKAELRIAQAENQSMRNSIATARAAGGNGGSANGPALKDRRDYLADFSGSLPDPKTAATPEEAASINTSNQRILAQADAVFSTNAEFGNILTAPQAAAAMRLAQDPANIKRVRDNNTGMIYETVAVNGKSVILGVGSMKPQATETPVAQVGPESPGTKTPMSSTVAKSYPHAGYETVQGAIDGAKRGDQKAIAYVAQIQNSGLPIQQREQIKNILSGK